MLRFPESTAWSSFTLFAKSRIPPLRSSSRRRRSRPGGRRLLDRQADLDTVAGGVAVGADDMGVVHQLFGLLTLDAVQRDAQVHLDGEAGRDRADAHIRRDL